MRYLFIVCSLLSLCGCEAVITGEDGGNVVVTFSPADGMYMRTAAADVFTKLNVMAFDASGNKVFSQVRTQTVDDDSFGTMSFSLTEGTYTIVAVGHSSEKSATIKSPQSVQFTASDGKKLTDTFSHCSTLVVSEENDPHTLPMYRAVAMFRLTLTDESIPSAVTSFRFEYTGGSANFNPSTLEGNTKSTQSELRSLSSDGTYEIFTFPYLSATGRLSIRVSALDAGGTIIFSRQFDDVPITRCRITEYRGMFFTDDPCSIHPVDVGFSVDEEWEGIDIIDF